MKMQGFSSFLFIGQFQCCKRDDIFINETFFIFYLRFRVLNKFNIEKLEIGQFT